MNNGDSADTVNQTNVKAEIASDSIAGENAVAATADKSDALQAWLSEMRKSLQMRIMYDLRRI